MSQVANNTKYDLNVFVVEPDFYARDYQMLLLGRHWLTAVVENAPNLSIAEQLFGLMSPKPDVVLINPVLAEADADINIIKSFLDHSKVYFLEQDKKFCFQKSVIPELLEYRHKIIGYGLRDEVKYSLPSTLYLAAKKSPVFTESVAMAGKNRHKIMRTFKEFLVVKSLSCRDALGNLSETKNDGLSDQDHLDINKDILKYLSILWLRNTDAADEAAEDKTSTVDKWYSRSQLKKFIETERDKKECLNNPDFGSIEHKKLIELFKRSENRYLIEQLCLKQTKELRISRNSWLFHLYTMPDITFPLLPPFP